jgi:YOP proteins translocation protein K (YscK)
VIDAANPATAEMDWATFMNRPAAYIDVTRLAACFGGNIRIPLCERLLAEGRLQDRLSATISEFYALATPVGPDAANAADQRIALLPAGKTRDLVRRAGAVFWANTIANAIRADEVRQLRGRLGDELYAFAVANRQLSERSGSLDLADATDAQIDEDGWRCLGGWCESQHKAISERVRLKRPASPAIDGGVTRPFSEIGPAIVRCAVV